MVHVARNAFVAAGGATNVADTDSDANSGIAPRPDGGSAPGVAVAALVGLATMFVPLTVLQAVSVVHVSGGGAMRAFGDVDTVCFDIVLVATAVTAWRMRRTTGASVPYMIYSTALASILLFLMAYIITNVGTLVRLRLMLAVPIWTALFGFARLPGALVRVERDAELDANRQLPLSGSSVASSRIPLSEQK
jgi:hypothetical protein